MRRFLAALAATCLLTWAAQCGAGSTLFLRGTAAAGFTSPLTDLSPRALWSNHRDAAMSSAIAVMRVRRVTAADEIDLWDFNPGTNQVKYTSGGSWTAETDTLYLVTLYDETGDGHHATQTTEASQPRVYLNATNGYPEIDFDGSNDRLEIPDHDDLSFNPNDAFSIAAHVYPDAAADFRIIEKTNEYFFAGNGSGDLRWYVIDGAIGDRIGRSAGAVPTGAWKLFTSTYNGTAANSGLDIWIDASESDSTDESVGTYSAMDNTTSDLTIGEFLGGYSDGKFSFVAIFSSELTSSDISNLDAYLGNY